MPAQLFGQRHVLTIAERNKAAVLQRFQKFFHGKEILFIELHRAGKRKPVLGILADGHVHAGRPYGAAHAQPGPSGPFHGIGHGRRFQLFEELKHVLRLLAEPLVFLEVFLQSGAVIDQGGQSLLLGFEIPVRLHGPRHFRNAGRVSLGRHGRDGRLNALTRGVEGRARLTKGPYADAGRKGSLLLLELDNGCRYRRDLFGLEIGLQGNVLPNAHLG